MILKHTLFLSPTHSTTEPTLQVQVLPGQGGDSDKECVRDH